MKEIKAFNTYLNVCFSVYVFHSISLIVTQMIAKNGKIYKILKQWFLLFYSFFFFFFPDLASVLFDIFELEIDIF